MVTAKIKTFLNQPYPWFYRGMNLWYFSGAIFFLTLIFNFVFEPFNVYRPEHKYGYFVICVIQSSIAATVSFITMGFSGLLVNELQWKIKKEFGLIILLFLFIGTAIFLGRDIVYDNPYNLSVKYFLEELRNTTLVGSLFFTIFISFNYRRLAKQHIKYAKNIILPDNQGQLKKGKQIRIKTRSESDDFFLHPDDLIFAKADGNYLEFYIAGQQNPERHVKRITIKDLEKQLSPFDFIIKTHRSYIVNTNKIKKVSGNAQGYLLSTPYPLEKIPVSRSMIPVFNAQFSV